MEAIIAQNSPPVVRLIVSSASVASNVGASEADNSLDVLESLIGVDVISVLEFSSSDKVPSSTASMAASEVSSSSFKNSEAEEMISGLDEADMADAEVDINVVLSEANEAVGSITADADVGRIIDGG